MTKLLNFSMIIYLLSISKLWIFVFYIHSYFPLDVRIYVFRMESQELREYLSQNLKKYRRVKGWSQFDLAEKAQISEQTVNSIEGLRLWPSDKTLSKIVTALEIEMYKLFVPQKLALQSEAVADLKHVIVTTVESLVHETLCDWEG